MTADPMLAAVPGAEAEVVDLLCELLRIDTTNAGESELTVGEAEAAEYVASRLQEVGLAPEVIQTTDSRRRAVVVRIPGSEPDAATRALIVHGHLDVVPAEASDWSRPPFGGEIDEDGGIPMVWGRGAVDMKDMDAMLLAVLRDWARRGVKPRRDIVAMFLPDEEAGGWHGAHWLTVNRPDLFEGVTEAVGEVGGFSFTVRDDLRLYMIQTAEKGVAWMRLRAEGRAGHGSMLNDDNAVTALCEAMTRIGNHEWPIHVGPTVRSFVAELADATGLELDPHDMPGLLQRLGPTARLIGATLMNTAAPTVLNAGYKTNVIPGHAIGEVDGRFLPGQEEEFFRTIDGLLGDRVVREFVNHDVALETTFDGPTVDLMAAALRAEDPYARPVPYMLSGGTDAKAFAPLGIRCFGFVPLQLPPTLDFGSMFHGVDERVPVDSIRFGVRVLDRFLRAC